MPATALPVAPDSAASARCDDCNYCPIHAQCIVRGGDDAFLKAWQSLALPTVTLKHAGQCLIDTGAPLRQLYIVRSGCLKTSFIDEAGNEHVRSFALPGDIVGLDALHRGRHTAATVAVTPAQLCPLPAAGVLHLSENHPFLMQRLFQRLSRQLNDAEILAAEATAEARLAAFLCGMHQRLPHGIHGAWQLPMPRRDIASHLRLATETVSRLFTRFQRRGLIRQQAQRLYLDQPQALARIAESAGLAEALPARAA